MSTRELVKGPEASVSGTVATGERHERARSIQRRSARIEEIEGAESTCCHEDEYKRQ